MAGKVRLFRLFYVVSSILILLLIIVTFLNQKNTEPRPLVRPSCISSSCHFNSWDRGLVTTSIPEVQKDCKKLFAKDMAEINRLELIKPKWNSTLSDSELLNTTRNCSFVREYFNNNFYTTKLESSFPIAFVFVINNSPQQIVRLLRVLYRPHNTYCIHPDKTSPPDFINTFQNIAGCLDNVYIASERLNVRWGHRSLMESVMSCYKDLMQIRDKQPKEQKWNYVINLCGKELPLKTNHQIVSHLLRLNGTSMVNAEKVNKHDHESLRRLKKPLPFTITFAKSLIFVALSPSFVNFLHKNSTSVQLYNFFRSNCRMPEEHYFATMYLLPNTPGGFRPDLPKEYYFDVAQCLWIFSKEEKAKKCHGKLVHNICIVDIGDLNLIMDRAKFHADALFHNKFYIENDHLVMDCMEERLVSQNILEYQEDRNNSNSNSCVCCSC